MVSFTAGWNAEYQKKANLYFMLANMYRANSHPRNVNDIKKTEVSLDRYKALLCLNILGYVW